MKVEIILRISYYQLFIKKKCLTIIEAEYLLKKENYVYKTLKEFQIAFNIFRKGNKSKIQSSQTFAVGKESNDKTFSIEIGCYCAGERKTDLRVIKII